MNNINKIALTLLCASLLVGNVAQAKYTKKGHASHGGIQEVKAATLDDSEDASLKKKKKSVKKTKKSKKAKKAH